MAASPAITARSIGQPRHNDRDHRLSRRASVSALAHQDPRYSRRPSARPAFSPARPGARLRAMPFELDPPDLAYFFDCGIVVRGLLAVWRATGEEEFLEAAASLGESMAADFASRTALHPVLSLPGKSPAQRDSARWSRVTRLLPAQSGHGVVGPVGGHRRGALSRTLPARAGSAPCGPATPFCRAMPTASR